MSAKQQENILFEKESQLLLLECFEKFPPELELIEYIKPELLSLLFHVAFTQYLQKFLIPFFWGRNILKYVLTFQVCDTGLQPQIVERGETEASLSWLKGGRSCCRGDGLCGVNGPRKTREPSQLSLFTSRSSLHLTR